MVIEQTFWTIAVRQHTDQSSSSSSTAAVLTSPDSRHSKSLYFTYENRARQEHNARSSAHCGTTRLHVVGTRPSTLDGTYWTDRLTSGDLVLELVNRRTDTSRVDGLRLAQESIAAAHD
jgi:hypothetical protein